MEKTSLEEVGKLQTAALADPDDTAFDRPAPDLQAALDDFIGSGKETAIDPSTIPVERFDQLSFIRGGTWNQDSINAWQASVFGLDGIDPLAPKGVMEKLEEETTEVRKALEQYRDFPTEANYDHVAEEMADLHITLVHLAGVMRMRVQSYVDMKMETNVDRKWCVNTGGSGRHVD